VARVAMAEKPAMVPIRVLACGPQIANRDRAGDRDLQRELRGRANRGMDVVSLLTCPACRERGSCRQREETLIRVSLLMLLGLAAGIAVAGRAKPEGLPIALDMSTVRLDAWVSARAQLMVNSTGFALRYDDLPVGDTVADQTFTRRYYHGKQLHNFCNRPWVFVANKIELQG